MVLARTWAELPERRARLGIGLHRLGWSPAEILRFIRGTLRAGGGSWAVGGFGAVARFSVGDGEACAVSEDGAQITADTGRGAVRFEISDRVRVLSSRTNEGPRTDEVIILAVPRGRDRPRPNAGLAALGADRDAIRPDDRRDRLYDLGIDSEAAAFCVRTSSPDLAGELDRRIGRPSADFLAEKGDGIVGDSPHRVVLSAVARVEVFTSITSSDGQAPDGPHARLSPALLALGRETPPGLDVPESFVPGAIFTPDPREVASRSAQVGRSRPRTEGSAV